MPDGLVPAVVVLPAGTRLTRVAVDHLGTTEPSASTSPRRFSPVYDSAGRVVPVLYAAEDLDCALGETVFHEAPDDPTVPWEVYRADLLAVRAGFLVLTRDITVADLSDAALTALGCSRADVVDPAFDDYGLTRTWGQAVWDRTAAQGIRWNSRRSGSRLAYLLFVGAPSQRDAGRTCDRRRDLDVDRPPLPLSIDPGLGLVMTAATARNITLVM